MTTISESVRNVLERARRLVLAGWCQESPALAMGRPVAPTVEASRYCAGGALWAAARDLYPAGAQGGSSDPRGRKDSSPRLCDRVYSYANQEVTKSLHELFGDQYADLAAYNDVPGRTPGEIVELFDRTLTRLSIRDSRAIVKKCTRCKEKKSLDSFSFSDPARPQYLHDRCKECEEKAR